MSYPRPKGAAQADFAAARQWEEEVGEWLGPFKVGNLTDPNRLDWWVPGLYLDAKEKKAVLNPRWHLLDGVEERDLFVIDELSIRKAAAKFPHAYFIIRDRPGGNRIFLARIDEVFTADRVRRNRVGSTQHAKGKWIISLRSFRQLTDPAVQLLPTVLHDQINMPWKTSACLSTEVVGEI